MILPQQYQEKMKDLLGEEFQEYLKTYDRQLKVGIRINTRKVSCEEFEKIAPYPIERVPWIANGYYCNPSDGWSKHPYYYAGLYYLQEPSAMTPANRLPISPGDRVLDLCAAPGGKATELGAKLQGQGMLVANDISNSRAKALLKNIELMGIPNCFVTSEEPEKLVSTFAGFFDKILVDAPCSGEGMFHKEPSMIKFYEQHGPQYYSPIQRQLLVQAAKMLKQGGKLLFSTCTFDPLEDEGSVAYLLAQCENIEQITMEEYEKFSSGFPTEGMDARKCIRIWPHIMEGEGHFLALFQKKDGEQERKIKEKTMEKVPKEVMEFLNDCEFDWKKGTFFSLQDQWYFVGQDAKVPDKLRYLRTGLYLGELKKKRFEPSQALAMVLKTKDYKVSISFSCDDIRVIKYLKGETVSIDDAHHQKGYCLVCVDDFPLGWAKIQNNTLKNKYHKGWRMQ